ncbi:uncharacterized protein [Amphiura filiformis]|uniref:uncharacterized protein n=1 Tax=Amphiura filiformis TaxID=82378 RepID=UPI003B22194A
MELLQAAIAGLTKECEQILIAGTNPNFKNQNGWTALHAAAEKDHTGTCEILLKYNANVNALGEGGWTPLHSAACHNHTGGTCEILLKYNANVNALEEPIICCHGDPLNEKDAYSKVASKPTENVAFVDRVPGRQWSSRVILDQSCRECNGTLTSEPFKESPWLLMLSYQDK